MPKDNRSLPPKAGPYSRPMLRMPEVGAMPKGTSLWVGRGGQWVIGTVIRWSGEGDSSHWYELAFDAAGGASEWHDLAPARRAIGTAVGGSWAFPEDEDISVCSAGARRRGGGGADWAAEQAEQTEPRQSARAGAGNAGGEQVRTHACPHCAAAFGEANKLMAHVRTVHEKRRDHACPHCAAAFGRASNLTKHVRTVHEKRREHACPHCAAAFTRASHLTKHVQIGRAHV